MCNPPMPYSSAAMRTTYVTTPMAMGQWKVRCPREGLYLLSTV
jgi:hypothetical protein